MKELKKCIVCGNEITFGNGNTRFCSETCHRLYINKNKKEWRKNNPEKYREQLDRINKKCREETARAHDVKAGKYVPPTFKELWKNADKLAQETMIAKYWRDHRDDRFSYGLYASMQETDPAMHREIRRYVLLCNGIDEDNELITDYDELCALCGQPACDTHHLVFGRGIRPLADSDGLMIPICRSCHEKIHGDATTGTLSKMLGQLQWETEHPDKGREGFRLRYGRSWL